MQKKYKLAVVIGRFQLFHSGHYKLIRHAQSIADNVIVLVGSSNVHKSIKNPWSFVDRETMIKSLFLDSVAIKPISDYPYDQAKWEREVQYAVKSYSNSKDVVLVGHKKDDSSFYLDKFIHWDYEEFNPVQTLDATTFRHKFFTDPNYDIDIDSSNILFSVRLFLREYAKTEEYQRLSEEYKAQLEYKIKWSSAPYKVIFTTVDAVVYFKGHILMVRRKNAPGKGMWALAGGFLDPKEWIKDGIIRELKEETNIDLPPTILRNSLKNVHVFEHPERSLRGRTITHTGLFVLDGIRDKKLPKVRAADDASDAKWFTLDEVNSLAKNNMVFEDHHHIINYMLIKTEDL